uniref:Sulfate_transp domain-containing protein n=1 Tax=Macrostomum lignano TaxID=282301 RepID=A0A1I8F4Z7_9PLAT
LEESSRGTVVLLALALLGDLFQFIPQAALAAVIIVAVLQMTDFRMLRRLWFVSKTDLLEWLVTFLVSLAAGIQYGILCGMGLSFAFLLYRYSRPGLETSVECMCNSGCGACQRMYNVQLWLCTCQCMYNVQLWLCAFSACIMCNSGC